MANRNDFGHPKRHIAHHRACQLAPVDVALDHHPVAIGPFIGRDDLRRMRLVCLDDDDAEARPLGHRLDHIGRLHRVLGGKIVPVHDLGFGDRNAVGLRQPLGHVLVHGDGRRQNAGMGIRNLEKFEDALDRAILAERAMQRVEGDVRPQIGQRPGDVTRHIDPGDAIADAFQFVRAFGPRTQAHRPFGGKSTHQDGDMFLGHGLSGVARTAGARHRTAQS